MHKTYAIATTRERLFYEISLTYNTKSQDVNPASYLVRVHRLN